MSGTQELCDGRLCRARALRAALWLPALLPGALRSVSCDPGWHSSDRSWLYAYVVLSRVDRDPNGPADWAVVTRIFERVGDGTLTLTLDDGRSFTVTPEHELWTFEDGWQPARDIEIAEHVRGLDDTPLAVISIDVDRTPRTVYNLEVAGARTYFAEGVWVHNNSCSLSNYRGRLAALEPPPAWMVRPEAHHDLPQAFIDRFQALGIDIHNPAYTRWVEAGNHEHQRWSNAFNAEWRQFFDTVDNPTAENVFSKMLQLRFDPRFQ